MLLRIHEVLAVELVEPRDPYVDDVGSSPQRVQEAEVGDEDKLGSRGGCLEDRLRRPGVRRVRLPNRNVIGGVPSLRVKTARGGS